MYYTVFWERREVKKRLAKSFLKAEGARFELAVRVNGQQFSRLSHSTTLPPFHF